MLIINVMETKWLPQRKTVVFMLVFYTISASINPALPQKLSEYTRGRWTIDICFHEDRKYDVTFVIDAAANHETFRNIQRFVVDVTRRLNLARSKARIGFITYGVNIKKTTYRKRWRHYTDVRDAVFKLNPTNPMKRNAGKALFAVSQKLNQKSPIKSFIILLIGGKSFDNVSKPAKIIQRKRGKTIVIGYDKANATQLRWTASKPTKYNLLMFENSEEVLMATDSVLSIICETVLNGKTPTTKYPIKKKSISETNSNLFGPRSIVSSLGSIQLLWDEKVRPPMLKYRVWWVPKDGILDVTVNETASVVTLTKLNPATIYKIKISPVVKKTYGRPLTVIAATSPLPVANLTAQVKYVEPCSLQKQLQRLHKAKQGVNLRPRDCEKNKAVLFIGWDKSFNSKYFMVSSEPNAARLVRVSKRSTRHFLTNLKPGAEYKLSVVTRGPKLRYSTPQHTTVVVAPVDPIRLDIVVVNLTTVAIRWQMPKDAIYDGFQIEAVSAFGKHLYRVEALSTEVPADTPRPFYTSLIDNLRPDTEYKITILAESKNTTSTEGLSKDFSTKVTPEFYDEPFLIFSGGDGIYAANAIKGETDSVQRLFPVLGGVVNAVYHSRWVKQKHNSFQWQKLLIWIERYSRDIKVTDLTSQSMTSTLVSGLLQPVGLIIDPYGETIYWSDIGSRSIGIASISLNHVSKSYQVNRQLITGDLKSPVSLAINIVDRYLFWGDLQGKIERSSMDGLHRTVLLRRPDLRPYSLTFCAETKMLHWIDAASGDLEMMTSYGTEHQIIYKSVTNSLLSISSLVRAGRRFYWFDDETNNVIMMQISNDTNRFESPSVIYEEADVPSVTAMTSFDSVSLERGNTGGFSSVKKLLSLMKESGNLSFPCHMSTCVGVCIPTTMKKSVCVDDCKPWQMLCHRSSETVCISKDLTCNGVMDCENGEDEDLPECEKEISEDFCGTEGKSAHGCHDTEKCVPFEVVCDGRLDCKDGSDEKNCPVQEQFCDFDLNDLCLWKQEDHDDDFDWLLHHSRTPSNNTGPLLDHTMKSLNGSYMYLEATTQDEEDIAQIVSVIFAKPVCVSFFYHMHGEATGEITLSVRDQSSGNDEMIWRKSGEQGAVWNKMIASVDRHELYRLVITGVRGSDYRSDIAIDDITIKDGLCTVMTECDFHNLDDSMCGYKLGGYWKLVSGEIAPPRSNPILAVRDKPMTQDLSEVLGPEWFYHEFKTEGIPGCSECYGAQLVRDISALQYAEDGINYAGVTLCNTNRYKIYLSKTLDGPFQNIADGAGKGEDHCEFVGGDNYAEKIGTYKECEGNVGYVRRRWGEKLDVEAYGFYRSIYFAAASYECPFTFPEFVIENDYKKWKKSLPNTYLHIDLATLMSNESLKSDSFKIPISLASNEMENPVTKTNHTIFTLSPTTTPKFRYAKIERAEIPSGWCLKFKYFMVGSTIESFRVSINKEYNVWIKTGDQVFGWKNTEVDIPYPATKYDVIFIATRGDGYDGSIGIDDVIIQHEPCHPRLSYRCKFDKNINEDCSFEILGEPHEQIIMKSLYKRSKFEPEIVKNHNYQSGVVTGKEVELTNGTNITSNSYLRSPVLPSLSRFYPVLCLTVNYRQRNDIGDVSVIVRSATSNEFHEVSLHKLPKKNSLIRPWLTYIAQIEESVPIVAEENFYLEFHGLNATWVNELTLDTVACSSVIEDLCSNSIRCSNGVCVKPELLCDGINDCGDWSDEVGCSSQCGNVADYFDVETNFDGSKEIEGTTCTHRIHGQLGKHTLLTVGTSDKAGSLKTVKVYKDFMKRKPGVIGERSGYFTNESLVFSSDEFSEKRKYLIESCDVTIVTEYARRNAFSNNTVNPIPMSYEMVEEDHCSLVCPDHQCLFNNRICDGVPGCSGGSDERDCARVVVKNGVKVLEVRHLDGPFAPICANDMTEKLADSVCKQLNDLHAERPLNKTRLPTYYDGVLPHKLVDDFQVTDSTMIQSLISSTNGEQMTGIAGFPTHPKKTAGKCTSRDTWVPNCISYQCGVRPMDVDPSTANDPHPILRIIGGERVKKGKWPWMASLVLKDRDHNCGATLISDTFVITAAHCFDEHDPELFTVRLGADTVKNFDKEAVMIEVKRGELHNKYNKAADIPDWDIALVEMESPVRFSTFISPICLPDGDMEFPPGTKCYIAGFGYVSEGRGIKNLLNDAMTPIISNIECDRDMYRGSITERMLCAGFPDDGGVGICHGDSGGPLMCPYEETGSWYLVGITSWSIGCANKGKPDVFSRILSHVEWINEHAGFNLSLPMQQPVTGTCGGTYYGKLTGSFASPGWPQKYKNDQKCTYTILADLGQTIHLSFDEFETEAYFDKVEIFSGDKEIPSRISQLSGEEMPSPLSLRTSALYISFKSDEDGNRKGFVGTWRISGKPLPYKGPQFSIDVRLGKIYPQKITTIAYRHLGKFHYTGIGPGGWPYYEQNPPRGVKHTLQYIPEAGNWTIRHYGANNKPSANEGLRIGCETPTPDLCSGYWEMWTGSKWIKLELILDVDKAITIAATTSKPTTKASTAPLSTVSPLFPVIHVITDTTQSVIVTPTDTTNPPFVTDKDESVSSCGGVLMSINGSITSPDYGIHDYSDNLNCTWFIQPNIDKPTWILIEVVKMKTQEHYDYLKGFVGHDTSKEPLFGLSGNGIHLEDDSDPEIVVSASQSEIEIRDEVEPWFGVFGGFGGFGFGPTLKTEPSTTQSTTTTKKPPSTIVTVLKYKDTHSKGMTLTFTSDSSVTDEGFMIKYYVIDDLTKSPLIDDKYVTIDVFANEPMKRKRRSVIPNWSYIYDEGSGDYADGSGYEYEYYDYETTIHTVQPNPDCNFTIKLENSITEFIKYKTPQSGEVKNCLWRLQTKSPIQYIDLDIKLGSYNGFVISYLFEIADDQEPNLLRLDLAPRNIFSKSLTGVGEVLIHFKTDGKYLGFNASATLRDFTTPSVSTASTTTDEQDNTATKSPATTAATFIPNEIKQTVVITSSCAETSGLENINEYFIKSPNYPNFYPENALCTWVLKAQSTHQISFEIVEIAIEEVSSECSYDNVTVYEDEMDSKPIGVYCGKIPPQKIISSGSVMIVRFASDRLIPDIGFKAIIKSIHSSQITKDEPTTSDNLLSCNFDDEDICGFHHHKADDVEFMWTKQFSATPSDNTGPPHDASETKDGYYMFIEASIPRVPGDRARIISPVIEAVPTEPVCLSFAYNMRGLSVGSLLVYVSIASDGAMVLPGKEIDLETGTENKYKLRPIVLNFGAGLDQERIKSTYRNSSEKSPWQQYILWSKTGEQDDVPWLYADVTFTPNSPFQLMFEGIRGIEYQSDIAIDDIIVKRGACEKKYCEENEFECNERSIAKPVCISTELLCDGHSDCEYGSDERKCDSPLQELCERMSFSSTNTTEWLICNNVEKCFPKSSNIGHVNDIACDGVYDCFGGYDESFCDETNKQEVVPTESAENCGIRESDEEETNRSEIHNISPKQMPWVGGLYIYVPDQNKQGGRFLFLCSAAFIREFWLLAPAHCILDPEMTKEDLENFLQNKEISKESEDVEDELENYEKIMAEPLNVLRFDDPYLTELNEVNEFKDLYPDEYYADDVIDQSETVFEYYIIMPTSNSEDSPIRHRVSKLVPHPEYSLMKPLRDCNITERNNVKFTDDSNIPVSTNESIECDINRINHDVTLIRIEHQNEMIDRTRTVCQNTGSDNMLTPPSEDVAYSTDFKSKATCFSVGFSFPTDGEKTKSDLVLSQKSVRLSLGDSSTARVVCGMQSLHEPTQNCLDYFESDNLLHPLLVGGYTEARNHAFMHDQGSMLMCKSWENHWYLAGIYSWANMFRNLQHDRLYKVDDESHVSGGILDHDLVLGSPLGVELYMDVAKISDWVEETLQEDCPGEFPCYDKSSGLSQKCIPKQKLCDGIIDCPLNYLDEINCASGCGYDSSVDPFGIHYRNLEEVDVILPEDIVIKYNLSDSKTNTGQFIEIGEKNPKSIIVSTKEDGNIHNGSFENNENSWISGVKTGKIRANAIKNQKLKMCIWTIKAPTDKVSVLHLKDFNVVPDENKIQIINNEQNEFVELNMKNVFYTSKPGGTISIRILPPEGQQYLTNIRYFEADHHVESAGVCTNRHRCGDGACVSPHHVCDGIWNCKDKSDEMECPSGCSGQGFIAGPSTGILTSRNFPLRHNGNGDCEWQFVSKSGNSVDLPKLFFEFYDFQTHSQDVVFLFRGAGIRKSGKNLLGAYAGDRGAFNVTIQARSATLLLRSNDFINQRRFRVKYTFGNPA